MIHFRLMYSLSWSVYPTRYVRRNDECHLLTCSTRLSRLDDKSANSRNEKEVRELLRYISNAEHNRS